MSVRERLEQKEQAEIEAKLDYVPPAIRTTQPQAGTTTSVRQRAERAASLAEPETVVHNSTTARCTTGVPLVATNSVRDRLQIAETIKELNKPTPKTEQSAAVDYYYDLYKENEQKEKAAEAKKLADAEARRLKEAADAEHRKNNLAVTLMYGNLGATPEEIAAVEQVCRKKISRRESEVQR